MSIIIRLQNLPWSANSLDIRRFFQGLSIPDGGVHIVGGDKGDAFIAFSNDEDARQAMSRDGGTIKDGCVKLMLSSRSEMKKVIEQARSATIAMKNATTPRTVDQLKSVNDSVVKNESVVNKEEYSVSEHNLTGGANLGNGSQMIAGAVRQPPPPTVAPNSYLDANVMMNAPPPPVTNGQLAPVIGGEQMPPMGGLSSMYAPTNGVEMSAPMPAPVSTLAPEKWTVELRGLPFNIVPQEIQDFFRAIGLFVQKENIKILVDDRGFTTGGAIVRMMSQRDFDTALLLNARFLGSRRIDVMPLMMEASPHMINMPPPNMPPFMAPAHPAHPMMPQANVLPPMAGAVGAVTATPFQPMPTLNATLPGPVVPAPTNPEVMFNMERKTSPEEVYHAPEDRRRPMTLFMKGIPFGGCNDADIKQFFAPIPVSDVLVLFEKSGKPSGDAYVEFIGEPNFEAAMNRNRKYMGHRYIELFPVTRNEMRRARANNPPARAQAGGFRGAGRGPPVPRRTFCIQITGLPPTIGNRELTDYFAQLDVHPYAVHIMLKADGMNAGEAYIEFVTSDQQRKALRRDGQVLGGCRLSCQPVAYETMQNIVGIPDRRRSPSPPGRAGRFRGGARRRIRSHSRSRSRSRSGSRSRSRSAESRDGLNGAHRSSDNGADLNGSAGLEGTCTVHMDNIPARASDDDLCAFLEEFAVQRSQIRREPVADGQPAGAAYIEFPSVQVAERAIRLKDRKYLIGRCISLKRI